MDTNKIINTIQNQYIHYDAILDTNKIKLQSLKKITNEQPFLEALKQILDELYDPHTNLRCKTNMDCILPIYLGIIGEQIIVVGENICYPLIKKGYVLESINGIKLESLLIRYDGYGSRTLALMKILELIATSDSETQVVLSFQTLENYDIVEKVRYSRLKLQHAKEMQGNKEFIKNKPDTDRKYKISYFRCPSLMNEKDMSRFISQLKESNTNEFIMLDIRNNLGGRIDCAAKLTELFIEEKKIIYLKSRKGISEIPLIPEKSAVRNKNLGILFNHLTCSSLEFIFLKSLIDIDHILLLGESTCGMRDVAAIYQLDSDYRLSLSIKKYVDSFGEDIKTKKIYPDYKIDFTMEDVIENTDRQLEKAVYMLKNR